jgi:hypothetical protein
MTSRSPLATSTGVAIEAASPDTTPGVIIENTTGGVVLLFHGEDPRPFGRRLPGQPAARKAEGDNSGLAAGVGRQMDGRGDVIPVTNLDHRLKAQCHTPWSDRPYADVDNGSYLATSKLPTASCHSAERNDPTRRPGVNLRVQTGGVPTRPAVSEPDPRPVG